MTAFSFGVSRANPPGPKTTTHEPPLEKVRAVPVSHADIEAAWHVLLDRDADDTRLADACRVLITLCRDGRRNTAQDMLRLLQGES